MTTSSNEKSLYSTDEMNSPEIQIIELDDDPKDVLFDSCIRNNLKIDNPVNSSTNKYIDCFQLDDDDSYDEAKINLQPSDYLNQPTSVNDSESIKKSCGLTSNQLVSQHNFLDHSVKEINQSNNQLSNLSNSQASNNQLNDNLNSQFNGQFSEVRTDNQYLGNSTRNPITNLNANQLVSQYDNNQLNQNIVKNVRSDQQILIINSPINQQQIQPQLNQQINQELNQQISYQIQPQVNQQQKTIVTNSASEILNQSANQPLNQSLEQAQPSDSLSIQQDSNRFLNSNQKANLKIKSLISTPSSLESDHAYEELKPSIFKIPDPNNPRIRTLTLKILPVNNHSSTNSANSLNNQKAPKIELREKRPANSTTSPTIQIINPVNNSASTVTNKLPKLIVKPPKMPAVIKQERDSQMEIESSSSCESEQILMENKVSKPKNSDLIVKSPPFSKCITEGCMNRPVKNKEWDQEYCSSKCLIKNCRDVFERYIKDRQRIDAAKKAKDL